MTRVDEMLDVVSEFRVAEWLVNESREVLYVCDQEFAAWFGPHRTEGASWSAITVDTLEAEPSRAKRHDQLVVCTVDEERSLRERVTRIADERRMRGLVSDVIPRRIAGRGIDNPRRTPHHRYAILCAPRSGSYFLASLLRRAGLGRPDEHLRSSVCELARRGVLDLRGYLDDAAANNSSNGWFGTKLIAHYLSEAFDSGLGLDGFIAHVVEHDCRLIYLYRDDKAQQAVSNFVAKRTGCWVRRDAGQEKELPQYDREAIHAEYDELVRCEEWLRSIVEHFDRVIRVRYEDLDTSTSETLARVVAELGANVPPRLEADTYKQRTPRSLEYAERFRSETGLG